MATRSRATPAIMSAGPEYPAAAVTTARRRIPPATASLVLDAAILIAIPPRCVLDPSKLRASRLLFASLMAGVA
jgi:hypothetical protein